MIRTRQALFALVVSRRFWSPHAAGLRSGPSHAGGPAADRDPSGTTRMLIVPFEVAIANRARCGSARPPPSPRRCAAGDAVARVTRAERVRAFEEANLPIDGRLSLASLVRVGHLVLASDLIVGTVRLSGKEMVIDERRIRLAPAAWSTDDRPRPAAELFALHERLARRLMGKQPTAGGTPTPAAAAAGALPLGAFENYIKGVIAEQPAAQIRFLQAALRIAPRDARTRLALAEVYADQGDHARALAEAQAVPPTAPLGRRARFLAGRSLVELARLDEAFQTFRGLADERPPPRSTTTSA